MLCTERHYRTAVLLYRVRCCGIDNAYSSQSPFMCRELGEGESLLFFVVGALLNCSIHKAVQFLISYRMISRIARYLIRCIDPQLSLHGLTLAAQFTPGCMGTMPGWAAYPAGIIFFSLPLSLSRLKTAPNPIDFWARAISLSSWVRSPPRGKRFASLLACLGRDDQWVNPTTAAARSSNDQ